MALQLGQLTINGESVDVPSFRIEETDSIILDMTPPNGVIRVFDERDQRIRRRWRRLPWYAKRRAPGRVAASLGLDFTAPTEGLTVQVKGHQI